MSDAERIAALERRIEALECREAIAALIYRYTEAVRLGRFDAVLDFVAADAVIELCHADPQDLEVTTPIARFAGHEEIRRSFTDQAGPGIQVWPMIHNLRIELDGDRARSVCVLESAVWPSGQQFVGEYSDTWTRRESRWLLASRRHMGFGEVTGRYAREAHAAYQAAKFAKT